MNRYRLSVLVCVLAPLVAAAQPSPIDLKGKTLADTFAELLPKMGKGDTAAQQQWQEICLRLGSPGSDKLRSEACALMTTKLDAKTPTVARLWLLTQLERIGREESVDAMAALLDEKDAAVREAAVRALANNPSPKATAKLTAKLAGTIGGAKIGLLNALGHRGDEAAAGELAQELKNPDEATAVAAARALGRTPGSTAMKLLAAARGSAAGPVRAAIGNALLAHADRMAAAADVGNAAALYTMLNTAEEARSVRLAAFRGVIQTAGDKAGERVLSALAADDYGAKAVAIGQIESLSVGAVKSLTGGLDTLPTADRVSVITALAARADRAVLPVALAAAKGTDADVRRAGLLALGRRGDASAVELLLDVMAGPDAPASVAAESLARLPAEVVDEKLTAALAAEKTSTRAVALIGVLDRRKAASAVPALLAHARGPNAAVRTAAFTALKSLAGPDHIAGMVAALARTEAGKERDAAELAVAAVCAQIPQAEKRAEPILAAVKESPDRTKDLLPLLGRVGGPDALKLLRANLAARDPALLAAARTGLLNWPDAAANADLLALAEQDKNAAALRALIRVNTAAGERTPEERAAALAVMKKAMPLATRDEERRAILEGLGNVRHIDTLRFVVPYLDDPALAQAACKGVVELAHSKMLREPNKAEFEKALDRVIGMCKDRGLVDRAKQYREGR